MALLYASNSDLNLYFIVKLVNYYIQMRVMVFLQTFRLLAFNTQNPYLLPALSTIVGLQSLI